MGLRQFFRGFFPIAPTEEILEDLFALTYHIPGMTPEYVENMTGSERLWWLQKMAQQKRDEVKALAEGTKG